MKKESTMNIRRLNIVTGIAGVLMAMSFLVLPSWGAEGTAVAPPVVKMEKMDMNRLKTLPDDAVIELKGKQTTKRQIMANREALRQQAQNKMKAESAKAAADFEAKRAAHVRDQRAKVDADNAKTEAETARRKSSAQQYAKIREEARQLQSKYNAATAEEQAKMDKRAEELMAELKKLGY